FEIDQIESVIRIAHRTSRNLNGVGRLQQGLRRQPDRQCWPDKGRVPHEPVQSQAFVFAQVAHLGAKERVGGDGGGNGTRCAERRSVLPLAHRAELGIEFSYPHRLRFVEQVAGHEQLVRDELLVNIGFQLDNIRILASAARFRVEPQLGLGGDCKTERRSASVQEAVLDLARNAVEARLPGILKVGHALDAVRLQEHGVCDHEVVGDAVFEFELVLQRGVGALALLETAGVVALDFELALTLGVRTFGEAEDVACVHAGLAALAALSPSLTELPSAALAALAALSPSLIELPSAALATFSAFAPRATLRLRARDGFASLVLGLR